MLEASYNPLHFVNIEKEAI